MSLSPGDRVDRYEVIELLGTGGMGEVYRARDPKLARLVALKILHIDSRTGTDGAARLLREARAAAALSHANVLAVFDIGEVQEPESLRGLAYIAMELVVGKSLRAYIGDEGIPLERRLGWLRDVALALGAAHVAGIVHRDVKPENVMVRFDGVVKVLDFGIARRNRASFDAWSSTQGHSLSTAATGGAPGPLSADGMGIAGTPFFMAPEQLRGEPLDGRADQFAWGVMAYMLLTGTPPWRGPSEPIGILSQILSYEPPAPIEANPRIPASVSGAVMKALAKDRESRFESMGALVAALDGKRAGSEFGKPPPVIGLTPAVSTTPTAPPSEGPRTGPLGTTRPGHGAAVRRTVGVVLAAAVVVGIAFAAIVASRAARRARGGGASGAAWGECATNADCVHAHGGGAWHCHSQKRACEEIASVDCKVYSEPHDAEADDVVWLGGMFPLHTDPGLVCEMRATDLARQDFAAALGSSSARSGPLHARPIGLVICDEGGDPLRAARHLAEDIEVPAVIGFRSTTSALTTIPTVFLPDHVLSFVSISQAPEITRIPEPAGEPRLVWRSTLNRFDFALVLAHFISDTLEPMIRLPPNGIGDRPLKVAAVWAKRGNHNFVETFFDALRYNGKSALENGTNFRQFIFEIDPDAGGNEVVKDLVAFAPQVIVYTNDAFFPRVLMPLEARWRPGSPRPTYLTGGGFGSPAPEFAGDNPAKRHRLFAVTNVSTTPTNAKLVLRYNLAFPDEPVPRTEAPQPSYDAFYTLAYATYALGDGPVTGPSLARAIERLLPPGRNVDVGPTQIFEGFEALRSGARIDLNGAIGSLDFNPTTGEAPIDYAIICPGVDDHGNASSPVDSGLVYDARAKRLVGTLHCP